ncbi:MAG TPA: methyltransferase [Polyangiaceae bacterium]
MNAPADELTHDALFGGAVEFWQPTRGYRVNIDSILLAAFAAQRPPTTTLDLGAGVGAVTLALNHLGAVARGVLVECEPDLARLAERNLRDAALDASVLVLDLAQHALPQELQAEVDLVVCNPPFFEPGQVRPPLNGAERRARSGELDPFLAAAAYALSGKRARACFAYPARALERFLDCSRQHGLVAKRLRFVHSDRSQPARLCLVEVRRARPGGLVVEAPLYEWEAQQVRSRELALLTGAEPSADDFSRTLQKADRS